MIQQYKLRSRQHFIHPQNNNINLQLQKRKNIIIYDTFFNSLYILQQMNTNYPKKRNYNKIQYSKETRQSNIKNKRGNQQDTASLNINLKSLNKIYLNHYIQQTQHQDQVQIINAYINLMKGSFQSTRKLFGGNGNQEYTQLAYRNIRKCMLRVYTSTGFIRTILSNEKMDLKSKLMLIKFLEKIRGACINPWEHRYWKQKI